MRRPPQAPIWQGVPPGSPDISIVSPWPSQPLSGLLRPCHRPLILTGAGVSAACGLPTGANLAHWLRNRDFAAGVTFSPLDAIDRGAHPGYVASHILEHDRSLRGHMLQAIAAHITSKQATATVSRVIRAVAASPVGVVLTLNYDTLTEDAALESGRAAHSLVLDDVPELLNDHLYDPDGDLRVVHLHGIAAEPGSLVLDHHSYMQQAGDNRVRDLFAALVAHHNLCVLGTQFEEDYLGAVMLARRPSRPRHVIVCDVDLADRVSTERAGLGADRHRWLPCAYPVGAHDVLETFAERLVSCDDLALEGGTLIAVDTLTVDTVYAPRRLIARDEVGRDSEMPTDMQLLFGNLRAHGEEILAQEQLSIVIGSPGSGKTRLLQELSSDTPGDERAVLVRLRDVRELVGEPEPLFHTWLEAGVTLSGEPVSVPDVLEDRVRLWVLLDGLDEASLDQRATLASAIERLAHAFPQHRFTVTSRPVAALADLSAAWRLFDLLCDDEWRRGFLTANEIDEARFWTALSSAGPELRSLLLIPFFLRGAVRLLETGQAVDDAMQISLTLLEQALQADEHLTLLGGATRRWLTRVAVLQQLTGHVTVGGDALAALAAEQNLGDPAVLTDLLAGRSLLAASAQRWAFTHRLFGEALVAEVLLEGNPGRWLPCVAPEYGGWSAVLDRWKAPLEMALSRSLPWRREVATRDPRFAARATPSHASVEERLAAASLLWRRAIEWDVWIDPGSRDAYTVTDGVIVGDLMRAGGLETLELEIRGALNAPTRFARGNAVDVLSFVPVADIAAVLAEVLDNDDDSVVRRSAASAARRLELTELADHVIQRAMAPDDESEAGDMASVAMRLSRPESKLAVATVLEEAGNTEVRDHAVLEDAPLSDRVAWLSRRANAEWGMSYSLGRELADLIGDAGGDADETLAEELGYVAALVESRDQRVADFVSSRPGAPQGVVWALQQGDASVWGSARLLIAAGAEALREAGAGENVLNTVVAWQTEHEQAALPPEEVEPDARAADDLRAAIRLPNRERRLALLRRPVHERRELDLLTDEDRDALRQTLDEWWGGADLRGAVRVTGTRATIDGWAVVVLNLAPAIDWTLDDERWVQVATCGWLFEPQIEWLMTHSSQARLDRSADSAAGDFKALTELLQIGVNLDPTTVCERLVEIDDADASDPELERAGEALLAAQSSRGLEMLAAKSARWYSALRRHLAAAGDLDSQLAELADLAGRLQAGERSDRFNLGWLEAVGDPRALPKLEAVLIAAGEARDPEAYPDVTAPVLNAIARLGDASAVELLDRVARDRPYPGAQFLVDDRDRLTQSLLEHSARPAARAIGEALGLPIEAELSNE